MIEFNALAMKADTDELHAIFLLKKNVRQDIIKTILGYLLIAIPETLKEWKVVIVVATTHWNGTRDMLTSAKLSVSYLVVGITRELDKEPSLY